MFDPKDLTEPIEVLESAFHDSEPGFVERLSASAEEKEYLRQIDEMKWENGATSFRQAQFFLEMKQAIALQELRWEVVKGEIRSLRHDVDAALCSDPFVLDRLNRLEYEVGIQ